MPRTTQLERIAVIETKVESIDTSVHELHSKLDDFIICADEKYAEKKRVDAISKDVSNIKLTMAKWSGVAITVITLIQVVLNKFLN